MQHRVHNTLHHAANTSKVLCSNKTIVSVDIVKQSLGSTVQTSGIETIHEYCVNEHVCAHVSSLFVIDDQSDTVIETEEEINDVHDEEYEADEAADEQGEVRWQHDPDDDEGDGAEECRNDQLPDEEYEQQARLLLSSLLFGMIHP